MEGTKVQEDVQYTCNVTLSRVRVMIGAGQKQSVLHILSLGL
jgi:hypothetical protein